MATQENATKRTLEQLQLIIPKLSKLLGRDFDLMKFHNDCQNLYNRIYTAMEILNALQAGTPAPFHASEVFLENLAKYLTRIRYIPENMAREQFLQRFTDSIESAYEVYSWLLSNQEKVTLRAYLTNFVDPMDIPNEFLNDPEIRKLYEHNKELIDFFWTEYTSYVTVEKSVTAAQELQSDLKAMFQEATNLEKRTKTQKEKLHNIANNENLILYGKAFHEANGQQSKISNEISITTSAIRNMERLIKDHEEEQRKYKNVNDVDVLNSLNEVYAMNKTLLDNGVKPEREQSGQTRHVLEETVRLTIPNEQLANQANNLKDEIQDLMNKKLSLHSSTEDKLGPFRKQAAGMANRKETLSEKVRDQRNKHDIVSNQLKLKESELYEVVGGEVYHGDKLKMFIGELRGKSLTYKKYRGKLQYWTGEAGVLNRTIDILKSTDPSVNDVLEQGNKLSDDKNQAPEDVHTDSITEAKQLNKKLLQEIESMTANTSQVHTELLGYKKDVDHVSERYEKTKETYEQATKYITKDVDNLREDLQNKQGKIEILEQQWKATAHELDKLDQVFGRLVDDLLDNDGDSNKESYYSQLLEKKKILEKMLENLELQLVDAEEKKLAKNRRIKFYKDLEALLLKKLEPQ